MEKTSQTLKIVLKGGFTVAVIKTGISVYWLFHKLQ
jgi:hypothetical protein